MEAYTSTGHIDIFADWRTNPFDFQEELAEGLHLIDFEQLKIENQTYNEKIEERNEVWNSFNYLN